MRLLLSGFILLLISACSTSKPNLHKTLLPESYLLDPAYADTEIEPQKSYKLIRLNHKPHLNRAVIRFWRSGAFRNFVEREHPVLRVKRKDIATLDDSLNRLFDIYFLASDKFAGIPVNALTTDLLKRANCRPLSNYEVQFMMNTSVENAFPQIPLTMLMITSHELLIQNGAQPVYPKVHSAYLRKILKLPPLLSLEKANLFATKTEDGVYSQVIQGFVFCRKTSQ